MHSLNCNILIYVYIGGILDVKIWEPPFLIWDTIYRKSIINKKQYADKDRKGLLYPYCEK